MSNTCLEEACRALSQSFPDVEVLFFPETESTNDALQQLARSGKQASTLIVTKNQTKGRGRMGKNWYSLGEALTFSFGFPYRPQTWDGLSLAVGLSLVQSLDAQQVIGLQVKWPNDIFWQGQKLGGILIETLHLQEAKAFSGRDPYAIIGIGLNIAAPKMDTVENQQLETEKTYGVVRDSRLRTAPAYLQSLLQEPSFSGGAAWVLKQVFPALLRDVSRFANNGFQPLMAAFAERDALYGKKVQCSDGRLGYALGVSAQGALLLCATEPSSKRTNIDINKATNNEHPKQQLEPIVAGEISVSLD